MLCYIWLSSIRLEEKAPSNQAVGSISLVINAYQYTFRLDGASARIRAELMTLSRTLTNRSAENQRSKILHTPESFAVGWQNHISVRRWFTNLGMMRSTSLSTAIFFSPLSDADLSVWRA